MDLALPLVTIAAMLALAVLAGVLLARLLKAIVELRGITIGLHDTLRWALGRVAAAEHPRDGSADSTR
jgi:hypothetical protein